MATEYALDAGKWHLFRDVKYWFFTMKNQEDGQVAAFWDRWLKEEAALRTGEAGIWSDSRMQDGGRGRKTKHIGTLNPNPYLQWRKWIGGVSKLCQLDSSKPAIGNFHSHSTYDSTVRKTLWTLPSSRKATHILPTTTHSQEKEAINQMHTVLGVRNPYVSPFLDSIDILPYYHRDFQHHEPTEPWKPTKTQ